MIDIKDAKPFWLPAAAGNCLRVLPEQGQADLFGDDALVLKTNRDAPEHPTIEQRTA